MWLAAVLLLPGCAGRRPPAVWSGPEAPAVATIKAGLEERAAALRTLRVRGIGEYTGREGVRRFQLQAVVEPPDHLRLFASAGSFASLFTLVVREDGFGLHLPLRREVLVAGPNEQLVVDGHELPVTPAALWPVLVPDRLAGRIPGDAAMTRDGAAQRIEWSGPRGREALWVSSEAGGVVRYRGVATGGEVLEILFDEYAWRDGVWYPGRTTILLPDLDARVVLRVSTVVSNPRLSPDLFALRFPADATIRQIGRGEGSP